MTMPLPLGEDPAPDMCRRWLRDVCRWLGPGFHPDTQGEDYVIPRPSLADHSPALTDEEVALYNDGIAACFRVLGDEIYKIGLDEQRRMLWGDDK